MHSNLLPVADIKIGGASAAGSTAVNLDYTIPDGAYSILFAVLFGATVTVAGGTPAIRVFQASQSDYSDAVELTSAKQLIVAGMASKQCLLEVVKPTKPYIRFQIDRTGNAGNSIIITEQMLIARLFRHQPEALHSADYSRSTVLAV